MREKRVGQSTPDSPAESASVLTIPLRDKYAVETRIMIPSPRLTPNFIFQPKTPDKSFLQIIEKYIYINPYSNFIFLSRSRKEKINPIPIFCYIRQNHSTFFYTKRVLYSPPRICPTSTPSRTHESVRNEFELSKHLRIIPRSVTTATGCTRNLSNESKVKHRHRQNRTAHL